MKARISRLSASAKAERERVNRPDFGVGLRGVAAAKKKLATLQRELAAVEKEAALLKKPGRVKY